VVGVVGAVVISMLVSVVYWAVVVPLRADPIIAGLGLSGLGLGATTFALQALLRWRADAARARRGCRVRSPGVQDGALAIVSGLSVVVWLTPLIAWACWLVLRRTRWGLTRGGR
jgi:ABC-type uncharacterized transport system permease subunit